jgi:hypothetical protein
MRAMRSPKKPLAAVAAAALALLGAASCSSGGSGGPPLGVASARPRASHSSSASSRPELPPESRFPVPPGFDNRHGWTEAVTDIESPSHGSWVIAPNAGLFVQAMNNEGKVHARKLDGGREVWTFTAPVKLRNVHTDLSVATGHDGEEIVVVVRSGISDGGGLATSGRVVTVDTVHATATGKAGAIRHFEYDGADVGDFTGGLLVSQQAQSLLTALDPATGREKRIGGAGTVRLPRCRTADMPPGAACSAPSTAKYATAAGVLSSFQQSSYCDYRWKSGNYLPCADGFAIGKAWNTGRVAPRRAGSATPLAVVGDYVVVDWTDFPGTTSEEASKKDVVAVHELHTGKLVAQVSCDITDAATGTGAVEPLSAQYTTQLSPDGDYLVSGEVGFDLAAGHGRCFAPTSTTKGVTLTAVDDTGRAYGLAYTASRWADVAYGTFPHDFGSDEAPVPARAVEADLRRGAPKALPAKDALPVFADKDMGLFLTSNTLAAYPVTADG